MQPTLCEIDDFGPVPVVQPRSVSELGDLVSRAAAADQALYPLGGRTMLDYGLPPERPGLGVDLRGLDQVIDYPARDMTITVRAGITLARLHHHLAAENQRLPIDVPQADRATLGGALAVNISGPRRYGCGTLRDYVIGISAVNDQGQEIKAGGRVVKNVAGYDLCKLFIGSLGTLGIITQVTLKLRPRPEEQALVTLGCRAEVLEALLDRLHQSQTRPVCLDLLNGPAAQRINQKVGTNLPEAPWVVVVGFEDNRAAVCWQVRQVIKEVPADLALGLDARVSQPTEPLWQALVEFPAAPAARATFQANLLPSATTAWCRQVTDLFPGLRLQAHAGSGIVLGHLEGDLPLERLQAGWKALQATAAAARGNLVLRRCPTPWKKVLPVWGSPRGDREVMRAIKENLDPRRLFNPGRFVDGL